MITSAAKQNRDFTFCTQLSFPSRTLTVLVLCLLSGVAWGQRGPGLRLGSLKLNPIFTASGAYDSNFWRESVADSTAPLNPVQTYIVDSRVKLQALQNERFEFVGDLQLTLRQIVAEDAKQTASTIDDGFGVSRVRSNVSLGILPMHTFSAALANEASYVEQPATENVVIDGYQIFRMNTGPSLIFSPGGGRSGKVLRLALGYRFDMLRTLDSDDPTGNRRDRDIQTIRFNGSWRFFPKTSLFVKSSYSQVNFARGSDLTADGQGRQPGANLDSAPIRVSGGLKGLFSRRLALTLEGGYMQSNHEVGESYSGPTALVEADYRIPDRLRLRLAYELRIGGDGFSNFFTLHRSSAKAAITLPMRLFLELGGGFDYYIYSRYGAPEWTYTLPERIEPMIRASVKFGWQVRQWLRTFVSYELESNESEFYYCLDPSDCFQNSPIDFAEFQRTIVQVGVTASY